MRRTRGIARKTFIGTVALAAALAFSTPLVDRVHAEKKPEAAKVELSPKEKKKLNKELVKAVNKGKLEKVKELVDEGADVNFKDIESYKQFTMGWSPLMYACRKGHLEIVEFLVEKGAELSVVETAEATPLMVAAVWRKVDVMEFLISKGADVNEKNKYGWTALMSAATNGSLKSVKFLVNNDAEINAKTTSHGENALFLAVWKSSVERVKIVKFLLKKKAKIDIQNKYEMTPLIRVVYTGSESLTELLLKKGADVNKKDKEGMTALMWAVRGRDKEIIKLLLSAKNIDINIKDDEEKTALDHARKKWIKKLLKAHGAETGT